MNNYYCPYCNPKYQFQKKSTSGELICGLCGDPLVKKPLIKINQIIAIIASLSLVLPLIYTFIILIKNQINPPSRNYQANANSIEKIIKIRFYQPLQSDLLKQDSLSSI
ncbi:DNA gyrase [Prochlorococcus sp. AH-716-K03]|nr:DNA gyrase [Prochlorococcus sp. AH-716-K03]